MINEEKLGGNCILKVILVSGIISFVQNEILGQLNPVERQLLVAAVGSGPSKPKMALEVGTWLGGGSTAHILDTLEKNGAGHLWGIEADRVIYEQMIQNLEKAVPNALHRFTPLFGFSQKVIPQWLAQQTEGFEIDLAFLDGGNNPMEQIVEFRLIDPHMPVGAVLMGHDAKLRKGKWLVPYLACLDHWQSELHNVSEEGLLIAKKTAKQPSRKSSQRARLALLRMQCAPVEIAAAIVPRSICRIVLGLLPQRFSRFLSDGRK
jgi:predicted O-methyltransferase YrrM